MRGIWDKCMHMKLTQMGMGRLGLRTSPELYMRIARPIRNKRDKFLNKYISSIFTKAKYVVAADFREGDHDIPEHIIIKKEVLAVIKVDK